MCETLKNLKNILEMEESIEKSNELSRFIEALKFNMDISSQGELDEIRRLISGYYYD